MSPRTLPQDSMRAPMEAMARRVVGAESAIREALAALRVGRGEQALALLEQYQLDREKDLAPGRKT